MDDKSFQQWSDTLAGLRQARQTFVDESLKEQGSAFDPKDYFDQQKKSLEQVVVQWWNYEKKSWEKVPPADSAFALQTMKSELEALVDFEIDALKRETGEVRGRISWSDAAMDKCENELSSFGAELQKNYLIKVDTLTTAPKKKKQPVPATVGRSNYSGGGGGHGFWLLTMFLVGLAFGAGPAVYFWDLSKKADARYEEERNKLLNDKRSLENSLAVLQDGYYQLAKGDIKNLPTLDEAIHAIQAGYKKKKSQVEDEFSRKRESLMRKEPAGGRLDRALEALKADKTARLARFDEQEKNECEPLRKQREVIRELMGR